MKPKLFKLFCKPCVLFVSLMALAFTLPSSAAVSDSDLFQKASQEMEQAAQEFIQGAEYKEQSVEDLTDQNYYSTKNFPNSSSQSVFLPDSDLHALVRSVLLIDAAEKQLTHVRYQIKYSMYMNSEVPELTQDYIEITRYNLGPSVHKELLEYMDAEYVAPVKEFGEGPHVSWRFVMSPLMGFQAQLESASRKEIPNSEAEKTMCFSMPCLGVQQAEMPANNTIDVDSLPSNEASYAMVSNSGTSTPARVVEDLWHVFSMHGMDPLPYKKDQPHFIFVISKDVDGQESNILALGQQTMVLDHTIESVWVQRFEIAGSDAFFEQSFVPR